MLWAALALAGEGTPTFSHGASELQLGSAPFQTAGYSRGRRDFGTVNVNAEYRRQVVRGFFFGLQAATHWVSYDQRRVDTFTARLEPKIGLRVRLGPSTELDTLVGVAMDFGSGGLRPGPVVSLGLRQWFGRSRFFFSIEPRLAPVLYGGSTLIGCSGYCNQTHIYNPGGTGVLLAVGTSFRVRPVSEIE